MKLTKSKLKQLIKEELAILAEEGDEDDWSEEEYYGSRTWEQDQEEAEKRDAHEDRMQDAEDHLRQKFADAIAISLSKGLSADVVQQQFDNAFNQVTTHGRDMRKP